jgi:uncharacterized hydrophobic protein (TIGR00271 family)
MARRIEVVVPNTYLDEVRSIISDRDKCNINSESSSPAVVTEIPCAGETMLHITVPGKNVPVVLKNLEKRDIGVKIGTVSLTSLDCLKPRFVRHQPRQTKSEESLPGEKRGKRRQRQSIFENLPSISDDPSFRDFRKPPLTLDEVYGIIVTGSHMTTTTWINLIGASVVGAGGAATNNVVFVVASMLVSPIMGPVLGITFAYRVADWKLLNHAFKNLIYQTLCAWCVGFFITIPLGLYNTHDDPWVPDPETICAFSDITNLIFSSVVACAAGVILGNAILKTTGGNSLIGIAITAGLLPPVVFSGMLLSFGIFHAEDEDSENDKTQEQYYRDSKITLLAYFVHLLCIGTFSNIIFFLKDVNPRFRELDDLKIEDAPTQQAHRRSLAELGVDGHGEGSSWLTKITPWFLLGATKKMQRGSVRQDSVLSPSADLESQQADNELPPVMSSSRLPFQTVEEDDVVQSALHDDIGQKNA